jgi:hypothetical protein
MVNVMTTRTGYELFLEKSGLTGNEAMEFLVMKWKQIMPTSDSDVDVEFVKKLAIEARRWKKTRHKA